MTTENNVAAQAGDEPMRKALQVCVKALEFRKERSANDEFALHLARIALAGSPRATADVERDAARYRWLREHGFGMPRLGADLDVSIDAAIATTKPGA